MEVIYQKPNQTINYSGSNLPVIIQNSYFVDLLGCLNIKTQSIVNVSQSKFVSSHIKMTIRVETTTESSFLFSCCLSCVSSTIGTNGDEGDILTLIASQNLLLEYNSFCGCATTCTNLNYGYLDLYKGNSIKMQFQNASYNSGARMPGNRFIASHLTYKKCFTGHSISSLASVQMDIFADAQIEQIAIQSMRQIGTSLKALYICQCTSQFSLKQCSFCDIDAAYDIYSKDEISITECYFSASSARKKQQCQIYYK